MDKNQGPINEPNKQELIKFRDSKEIELARLEAKSIVKRDRLPHWWDSYELWSENLNRDFIGNYTAVRDLAPNRNMPTQEHKSKSNNTMKITSSKMIYSQERGSLNKYEIFMSWIFNIRREKKLLFDFEIETEPDNLQVNDHVIGFNHVSLLVTKRLRDGKFVLRTKELHPCIPFIGSDLIVVGRLFVKGTACFSDALQSKSFLCSEKYEEKYCEKCPEMITEMIPHPAGPPTAPKVEERRCNQDYWNESI